MSNSSVVSDEFKSPWGQFGPGLRERNPKQGIESSQSLAASITRAASKQTYYIVRFLVDRDRISDAYRAYAYFRWVDDCLDQRVAGRSERIAFIDRQGALLNRGYRNDWPDDLSIEEHMLVDLVRGDQETNSGLQAYLRNMMTVMAFDADRKGRLISQPELAEYARLLATAVTEALHYFIGHNCPPPQNEARYLAATAAHITHMLRDALEDAAIGYYNIPREFLEAHQIEPYEIESDPYRAWVQSRVQLARSYFKAGKSYLAQVQPLRCRMAGYLYIARFEAVLEAIEREGYRLRPAYPECKSLRTGMRMGWSLLSMGRAHRPHGSVSPPLPVR